MAYAAYIGDGMIQIYHIFKRKSSLDISLKGLSIRILAGTILFLKFLTISEIYLIIGQGLFLLVLIIYLSISVKYRLRQFEN